jgi:pimeloyl-ACP methyl ester carboxylesterase
MAYTDNIVPLIGLQPAWTGFLALIGFLLLFIGFLWIKPVAASPRESDPHPATSYKEAERRFDVIYQDERGKPELNPVCHSKLLTHGRPTEVTFVLYHGLTSCPYQFAELGRQLHELGFNIFIPRLPVHGYTDRNVRHLAGLQVKGLTSFVDQTIDIASGLGKRVVLIGLSGGANLASWAAHTRTDVEAVVLLNPFYCVAQVPAWLSKPVTNLGLLLPNMNFHTTDPGRSTAGISTLGLSTRGEIQFMRLAETILDMSKQRPPFVRKIGVLMVEGDPTVNNDRTRVLLRRWRRYPDVTLISQEFGKERGLPHDMIDPRNKRQQVGFVYPLIIDLAFRLLGR